MDVPECSQLCDEYLSRLQSLAGMAAMSLREKGLGGGFVVSIYI